MSWTAGPRLLPAIAELLDNPERLDHPTSKAIKNYVPEWNEGDRGFAEYLVVADVTCQNQSGMSIFDLADTTWREYYDSGVSPGLAVTELLLEEGLIEG